jgi:AbrB family looped-hinge helix DNA binding protein
MTSKGHTTIPKEIREGLRMKTGDRMTFTLLPDGTVLMGDEQERHECRGSALQEGPKGAARRRSLSLMIGLDTNVLVRFLVPDDEEQLAHAERLIRRSANAGEPV